MDPTAEDIRRQEKAVEAFLIKYNCKPETPEEINEAYNLLNSGIYE